VRSPTNRKPEIFFLIYKFTTANSKCCHTYIFINKWCWLVDVVWSNANFVLLY